LFYNKNHVHIKDFKWVFYVKFIVKISVSVLKILRMILYLKTIEKIETPF
ncbi:hypothetical protein BDF21DRAFT_434545, partial [Thamnidium elegans]